MIVGFIGVGSIGRPMAMQLVDADVELIVHDVAREAAASLLVAGAQWANSPEEVAQRSDVVSTCLPGPDEFREVVFGPDGIVAGASRGSILIDHTTNSPALVRETHAKLSELGVSMLDAPVSGGAEGARTRDLTMLVGGDSTVVERCRPILESIAKTVLHVGTIGAGSVCKVVHNCATFSLDMATVECLTLGARAGVDPAVLVEVFQRCAIGGNFNLHTRLPATLFRGDFEPRFALKTASKDMGLAMEMATDLDVPMSLSEVCAAEMRDAMANGWGELDSSVFLTLQEERAGVQLRLV